MKKIPEGRVVYMNIKEARIEAGLTQEQLSELISIPIKDIKDWDKGNSEPPKYVKKLVIEEIERISTREEELKNINSDEFFSLEIDDAAWYEKFAENFKREYDRDPIPRNATELIDAYLKASAREKVIIIDCLISKLYYGGDIQLTKENYEIGETIIDIKWNDVIAEFGTDEKGINLIFAKNNERMKFYLNQVHVECDSEGVIVAFKAKHISSHGLFIVK